MRDERICVGAHDLADFKNLRLYRRDGTYLTTSSNVSVGQLLELTYHPKPDIVPPPCERRGRQSGGAEPDGLR